VHRLLQEFVEKHRSGLEVVYTLSGWLKGDPPNYHIRLVSSPKLAGDILFYSCSYGDIL
jgi:DNA polymerase delta subunit 3